MQHTKEYADTLDPTGLRLKGFKARALSAGFPNLLQRLKISEMRGPYPIAIPLSLVVSIYIRPPFWICRPSTVAFGVSTSTLSPTALAKWLESISAQASHTAPILASLPLESTVEEQQEPSTLCQSVNNQCTAA